MMAFTLLTMGIFGGMITLVVYELVQEMRGSKNKLTDRYHE
jgi:ABC-type Co2+ transport system permease subunit